VFTANKAAMTVITQPALSLIFASRSERDSGFFSSAISTPFLVLIVVLYLALLLININSKNHLLLKK
jgi:hypothetical protein